MSLVSVRDLTKRFTSRDGAVTVALDRVSFDIGQGEFIAVVGPSGCGKSTLLAILAGVLERSSGEVQLDGKPVNGPSRQVGVVFQDALLLPYRSILDNVLLPAVIRRQNLTAMRPRAVELLRLVKLDGFGARYPSELSGGMQQRAAIARALLSDPAVLLMDEPFGALDAMTREQMNLDVLKIWSGSGKTMMLITHSIAEAVLMADRVIVMSPRPGRIVDVLGIDLPRPRSLDMMATPEFGQHARRIRALLELEAVA